MVAIKRKLTKKQASLLAFLEEFWLDKGYPPKLVEMSRNFKVTNKAILDMLSALERKGFIKRDNGTSTIKILKGVLSVPTIKYEDWVQGTVNKGINRARTTYTRFAGTDSIEAKFQNYEIRQYSLSENQAT